MDADCPGAREGDYGCDDVEGAWMGLAGCVACCVLAVRSPGNGGDCVRRFPPGPKASMTGRQVKRVFGTIQGFDTLLPHRAVTPLTALSPRMGIASVCSGKRNQGHGLFFLLCSLPSSPASNDPPTHKRPSNPSPAVPLLSCNTRDPLPCLPHTSSPSTPGLWTCINLHLDWPLTLPLTIQQCPISVPASSAQPHRLAPLSSHPSRSQPTSPRPILRMLPHNIIAVPFKWTSLS